MHARPLFVPSLLLACGAGIGVSPPPLGRLACAGLALVAAGLLFAGVARAGPPWPRAVSLLAAAALSVGVCRGLVRGPPEHDAALEHALEATTELPAGKQGLRRIEGRVLSTERRREGIEAVVRLERRELLADLGLSDAGARDARALLLVHGALHRGDRVRLGARLWIPMGLFNPGGRDRRADLAARKIGLEGTAEVQEVLAAGPVFWRWLDDFRARTAARCLALATSPDRGGLLAALAVGDRTALPSSVEEELSISGLVHLLSSAGLHLAAVAWALRRAGAALWLRLPWANRARASAAGAILAVPAVIAEVLLLGAPWPAMRAGFGAMLALAAACGPRRGDGLTALGLACAGCAFLDPAAMHDLALQLSILGVGGMIVLTGPLRDLLPAEPKGPRTAWRRIAGWALDLGCATLAASLATAPLIAAVFHRLSFISVAANTVGLAPGLAAIPVLRAAVLLDPIASGLALPLFWLADLLAGATLLASHLFAAAPAASSTVPSPSAFFCVLWFLALAALAGAPAPVGPGSSAARPRPRVRLLRAAVPLVLLFSWAAARRAAEAHERGLEVFFLAVGQGDATLLRFPDGRTMLVDAGGDLRGFPAPLGPGKQDPGLRVILPALAELGIRRLDWLVLSHPHPDHGGGMLTVLDRVPVGELWTTGEPGPGALGDVVVAFAREKRVPVRIASPGVRTLGKGTVVQILAPRLWSESRTTNDNSLVLRIQHGATALLLGGDAEALAELELAAGAASLSAGVLKANHHGSATSSTDAFLRRVRPSEMVFCLGRGNAFGFPNAGVVTRAEEAGARTWRTDRGAVLVRGDGQRLRLEQIGR